MPGPLLHVGASVLCAHGGTATPTAPNPRVLVGGQPTVLITAPLRDRRLSVRAGRYVGAVHDGDVDGRPQPG